jgi:zinc protease
MADRMIRIIYDEIDKLAANAPDAETIENAKKYWMKSFQDRQKENGYYSGLLQYYYLHGIDQHTDYEKTVNGITPETVHEAAKRALTQGNVIEIVMSPEE